MVKSAYFWEGIRDETVCQRQWGKIFDGPSGCQRDRGETAGAGAPAVLDGVDEEADPAVDEAGHPERRSLDEVVDHLGRTLGDVSSVPGGDLILPAQRPTKGADLGPAGEVLEILSETLDELLG